MISSPSTGADSLRRTRNASSRFIRHQHHLVSLCAFHQGKKCVLEKSVVAGTDTETAQSILSGVLFVTIVQDADES